MSERMPKTFSEALTRASAQLTRKSMSAIFHIEQNMDSLVEIINDIVKAHNEDMEKLKGTDGSKKAVIKELETTLSMTFGTLTEFTDATYGLIEDYKKQIRRIADAEMDAIERENDGYRIVEES